MRETISLYEPHEGRWIEVPMELVHKHDADLVCVGPQGTPPMLSAPGIDIPEFMTPDGGTMRHGMPAASAMD